MPSWEKSHKNCKIRLGGLSWGAAAILMCWCMFHSLLCTPWKLAIQLLNQITLQHITVMCKFTSWIVPNAKSGQLQWVQMSAFFEVLCSMTMRVSSTSNEATCELWEKKISWSWAKKSSLIGRETFTGSKSIFVYILMRLLLLWTIGSFYRSFFSWYRSYVSVKKKIVF